MLTAARSLPEGKRTVGTARKSGYPTVHSTFVLPGRNCTALGFPVRRWINVALVRPSECLPNGEGSSAMLAIQSDAGRANFHADRGRSLPRRPVNG